MSNRLHDHNKYHVLKRCDEGTVKSYKGFEFQWNEFRKKKKLNVNDITLDLYLEFVKFFIKKNYSPNTIGRHIKHLKSILRAAREEGLHSNTAFENKDFRVTRMPVQNIYLTEDEIRRLFDLPLDGFDEKVRDLFLIGCYTAQRFSDYKRINPDMLGTLPNGSRSIELIQKKTGTKVVIPIRPEVDYLLKKYDYCSPRASEQKVNGHIKEIARAAKITDTVAIEKTRGGLRKSETLSKCDLIMAHTARRSGCTNMFKAGIPPIEIMNISGHQTEKEFLKYILIDEEEAALRLSVHPYFNKPVLRPDDNPREQKLPVELHHLLDFSSN